MINTLAKAIHQTAKEKGWWNSPNDAEKIALMHSELSEALEGLRNPQQSVHIPGFSSVEEELADCIIRILDYAEYKNYNMHNVIVAKMKYNTTREYMHGGKKF